MASVERGECKPVSQPCELFSCCNIFGYWLKVLYWDTGSERVCIRHN